MDKVIPVVTFTVRPSDCPGMTREVRILFKKTHKLYGIAKKNKIESDIELFSDAQREAKKRWRKAKAVFYGRIYDTNIVNPVGKSASLWKIIK